MYSQLTHFSHWVELVDVADANIGQTRAASLIMDVLLHQALHLIIALSVIRGTKLGGTLRGALKRDRCTVVKPFSGSVDPVPDGILTIALVHFHVGDIVRFTLVFVVKMRLLPLLRTSTSTYVHALGSVRARSCHVLPLVLIPLQIGQHWITNIPLDKLFL